MKKDIETGRQMIENYHTHTWRCHHADGTERDYIEQAIEAGLEVLGFSDHAPCIYPDGYVASYKMLPCQLEDYVNTLLDLRREYAGRIEILIGLEAEYYPALWKDFLRLLEPYPIDYLLLGQHFLDNEYDNPYYCGKKSSSAERLRKYCSQCMEALETGRFLYFAHPDLIHFTGEDAVYEREMTKLCRFCREREIPLEMNLLGVRETRNYPGELFWRIAAGEGNKVILGSDAHKPEHVCSPDVIGKAQEILKKCGFEKDQIIEKL